MDKTIGVLLTEARAMRRKMADANTAARTSMLDAIPGGDFWECRKGKEADEQESRLALACLRRLDPTHARQSTNDHLT